MAVAALVAGIGYPLLLLTVQDGQALVGIAAFVYGFLGGVVMSYMAAATYDEHSERKHKNETA